MLSVRVGCLRLRCWKGVCELCVRGVCAGSVCGQCVPRACAGRGCRQCVVGEWQDQVCVYYIHLWTTDIVLGLVFRLVIECIDRN